MSSVSSSKLPPAGSCLIFCRISKGEEEIFAYNTGELDHDPSAELTAPSFHSWFSHSDAGRTYGFLVRDGYTFFAVHERSSGDLDNLAFLNRVRVGFLKTMEKQRDCITASSPILRRLIDLDAAVNRKIMASPEQQVSGVGDAYDRSSAVDGGWRIGIAQESHAELVAAAAASQSGRKWWLRQVKKVIFVYVVVSLGLLLVWLKACRGFKCLSR